jgi:uracil-DNA glycosylase
MERCGACPKQNTCVPADGPEDAEILFVGEAPGWEENKKGRPFCGRTGKETNEGYLPLAGLKRRNGRVKVRFDNAIHCLPVTVGGKLNLDRQKDLELLLSCASKHLYPDLKRLRPKLIVPMGAFACRALSPDIDLELHHGRPFPTKWGMTFPMYHPAGGLHEPKKMLHIRTDWAGLRKYLAGTLYLPEDEVGENVDYSEILEPEELDLYLQNRDDYGMGCDTETTRRGDPFCLTISVGTGTGRLIQATNEKVLVRLRHQLMKWRGLFWWHSWLFDAQVVAKMGLEFNPKLIRDTMEQSFLLGNIPQGLKALSFRELGMRMQDFDDLVTPFAYPKVLNYYRRMRLVKWPKPPSQMKRQDDGTMKKYQPQAVSTKLKLFFTYLKKNEQKDIFKAWKNWEEEHEQIEETMKERWPGKCITYAWEADPKAVIWYACRDADATRRLGPVLAQMRQRVRRTVQENWRDAA